MSGDIKQNVDTNSTEFNEGVEAGLNSAEDTKNWKAGNALGLALKEEGEINEPVRGSQVNEPSTPLFVKASVAGKQGNAQAEKDATAE